MKEVISGASQLMTGQLADTAKGQWDSLKAQQAEEFLGWLNGLTGEVGVEQDRRRRGLDGSTGQQGEEGVGQINGLIGEEGFGQIDESTV